MPRKTKYKQFLDSRNLSQMDVVRGTGMVPSAVSIFSNNRGNIQATTLKKLVIFHKCNPGDILDWEMWIADDEASKPKVKAKK